MEQSNLVATAKADRQATADERHPRTGRDVSSIQRQFLEHLHYDLADTNETATLHDRYMALAWTVRDRVIDRWIKTQNAYYENRVKRVYYLSLEFLIGRSLGNNVINLQMEESVREAMQELELDWEDLRDEEVDAGLGNGGLGRLAACYLESMATMDIPAHGYSLRYEHGIFQQSFVNGFQVEKPDSWLRGGNPWEIPRPDCSVPVHFGGRVEMHHHDGKLRVHWVADETICGIPYDIPTVGYGGHTVGTLRLWQAVAPDEFDFADFNRGDYIGAVNHKIWAENITKVLYPNDDTQMGKELRFRQQYFFVACALFDIFRRFRKTSRDWNELPELVAIQLNDTHPTLAIPEMLRILLDLEHLEWDQAWHLAQKCFAFTNHTLLSEALESWPAQMFEKLLPRHYQIICEINHRFLKQVAAVYPGDIERRRRMSIIEEAEKPRVRMANLAIVGSHSVNGVAKVHSELVKSRLVPDFAQMWPERFNNKTNGVTPRRWLLKANQPLAELLIEHIGDGWITDLTQLSKLRSLAEDPEFRHAFRETKFKAKLKLADYCRRYHGVKIDPQMRLDVQCKRIHTYKRQLLTAMHAVAIYHQLRTDQLPDFPPTAIIFSGKAAPGFYLAKLVIKLINNIAEIVNNDPKVKDRLNIHFIPNYRVSLAERLIPAADLSEQVSVAGTEASGTGNMKFMMNGALTIGTLDGANIEIVEQVGQDNAFIFGLTVDEVEASREWYNPQWHYENDEMARIVTDMIFDEKIFNADEPDIFIPIRRFLFEDGDHYRHYADFDSYCAAHVRATELYRDPEQWARKAILNIAASGMFSSDRAVTDYAREIWQTKPCPIPPNHD